jgi:hypothetical protein
VLARGFALVAPEQVDPIADTTAGAIIGLFVGMLAILAMSIGRAQWRGFLIRLLGGAIGGLAGGAVLGLIQAWIFSEPRWFLEMLIPLGAITVGATIGAIVCAQLADRAFRAK